MCHFLSRKIRIYQYSPIHIPFLYREPCILRRRKGPETHRVPSSRRIAANRLDFRRISWTRTCMCSSRVAKELCGAQGPAGRSPFQFLPIEGYVSQLSFCHTHATMHTLLFALSRCPSFSLFLHDSFALFHSPSSIRNSWLRTIAA